MPDIGKDLLHQIPDRFLDPSKTGTGNMLVTGLLQIGQLLKKLGLAKVALEILQQPGHIVAGTAEKGYFSPQQRKACVDKSFLFRYCCSSFVIGTGIGDTPPQHITTFIHH